MIFPLPQEIQPTHGTTRTIIKFCWFPTKVEGARIWLENIEILEAYFLKEERIFLDGEWQGVLLGNWAEISKRQMRWKRI